MSKILLTGAANGLGRDIEKFLLADGHEVIQFDKEYGDDVVNPDVITLNALVREIGGLDILINCAGINLINWLENVSEEEWDAVMDTNVKGIFTMTQACLPHLIDSIGTVLNIVSNAAHIPMTCSAAYNASKGAALILTKQLARELTKKHGITVFSISPNKLAGTKMSDSIDKQVTRTRGWTEEFAHQYQINSLLTGEETPTHRVAEFIAFLLRDKEHHKYLTGCDIPYGA